MEILIMIFSLLLISCLAFSQGFGAVYLLKMYPKTLKYLTYVIAPLLVLILVYIFTGNLATEYSTGSIGFFDSVASSYSWLDFLDFMMYMAGVIFGVKECNKILAKQEVSKIIDLTEQN